MADLWPPPLPTVVEVVCPGQRYHWLGTWCACDGCWACNMGLGKPPVLSFYIVAHGTKLQADIHFFPDLAPEDAPPQIPKPGIEDLRPGWFGSPEPDAAVSTSRRACFRRRKRKVEVTLDHLFILLPEWCDGCTTMPFADLVELGVSCAYIVRVKAPGLFFDGDWAELQDRHLAQFEEHLENQHWDRYSHDIVDDDAVKLALHDDEHFQFHLDGFRNWLRRDVLKNDESSRHALYPHAPRRSLSRRAPVRF